MITKIVLNFYYFSLGVWMLSLMFFLIQLTVIFGLVLTA
jgi:hypothetical protein